MKTKDRIVKLEERNGAQLVIAGTDKDFRLAIRSLRATATELELRTSYENGPTPYLCGTCSLDKHDAISIIGYEDARSTELELKIRGADIGDFVDTEIVDDATTPYTVAIGYLEKDAELGISSHFFMDICVSRRVLMHIAECVKEGVLEKLHIGVDTHDLYLAGFDTYAYPSMRVGWYLRPSKDTGRADDPELGNGRLNQLVMIHKRPAPRPRKEQVRVEYRQEQGEEAVATATAARVAADMEIARVDALRSIAKGLQVLPWVIGFTAFALLLN